MLTEEQIKKIKEATPEQQKEIKKILRSTGFRLFGIGLKFMLGLFAANMITTIFGIAILKDSDPSALAGFQFGAMILNFLFMSSYLNGQFKSNSDTLRNKIDEYFKNQ